MRIVFLAILIATSLYADVPYSMYQLFKQKNYDRACSLGYKNFQRYQRDENFLNLYGFSCLYADKIDHLAVPLTLLKNSKTARANSAYFATILMEKKLLFHALKDNYPLHNFKLPSTDYILSKVFRAYSQLTINTKQRVYTLQDTQDPHATYKLFIEKEGPRSKMVIEEFYDTMLVKRHEYY